MTTEKDHRREILDYFQPGCWYKGIDSSEGDLFLILSENSLQSTELRVGFNVWVARGYGKMAGPHLKVWALWSADTKYYSRATL